MELGSLGAGFGGIGTAGKFAARFIGGALLGAGAGAGQTLQKEGSTFKDVAKGAGVGALVGAAIPVAGEAFQLAKKFLGMVGKGAAAGVSGVGSDVIEAVGANPRVAQQAMRGNATETLTNLSGQVRQKVSTFAKEAEEAYSLALDQLPKRLGRTPQALAPGQRTTVKVAGQSVPLTMQGVKANLTSQLRRFGVELNPSKAEFDFLEAPFVGSEAETLKKVFGVVQSWKDTSPAGLNKLAIKIGQYRKSGIQSPEFKLCH